MKIIKSIEDSLQKNLKNISTIDDNEVKILIKKKISESNLSSMSKEEKNEIIQKISNHFFEIDDKTSNNKK